MEQVQTILGYVCRLVVVMAMVGGFTHRAEAQSYSLLWGRAGEKWQASGRVTDFSYAGYHRGERELPRLEPGISVRDFGALGDGKADDTAAFKRAIEAGGGKVIHIPAGRYVITDILTINQAGTCLLGDGRDKTVLVMTKPLNDIKPDWGATTEGRRTSNYSWSGGMIQVTGREESPEVGRVIGSAVRGQSVLSISASAGIAPGEFVRLEMVDDAKQSLTEHLYANDPSSISLLRRTGVRFGAKVVAFDGASGRVTLDRPLWTDVRLEWSPRLVVDRSSVEEVGIEGMTFEFPVTTYKGHFTEVGFNPLVMGGVRNCWVRSVRILNADSGPFISGRNVTVRDVVWESKRESKDRGYVGHHGITLSGQDVLLEDFDFRCRFIHDITMTRGSAGNVVRRGRAEDLSLDHHRYAPHNNLFTKIDAGVGSRLFMSGGGADRGRHCGAWTTLWNIRSREPIGWPVKWSPDLLSIVGVRSKDKPSLNLRGRWLEPIDPSMIDPPDLYEAQLRRRLAVP
jgi:hypothetical protein